MKVLETKAFNLGNSTVITLPKVLGIRSGVKMKIEKKSKKIILTYNLPELEKKVDKLSGGLRLNKKYSPVAINKILDRQYAKLLS